MNKLDKHELVPNLEMYKCINRSISVGNNWQKKRE